MAPDEAKNEINDPSPNVVRFVDGAVKRIEDILQLGLDNIENSMKTQLGYLRRESEAESSRINALRDVDTKAVEVALAGAVKQAEVLRVLVDSTATAMATALKQMVDQLVERIAALEKAQYENVGKSSAPSDLAEKVTALESIINKNEGRSGISGQLQMVIVGVICTLITGIIFLVLKL